MNTRNTMTATTTPTSAVPMTVAVSALAGEPVPQSAGRCDTDVDVLAQQVALGHQRHGGGAHAAEILLARVVALLDRWPRIALRLALAPGARERERGAGERQSLLGA